MPRATKQCGQSAVGQPLSDTTSFCTVAGEEPSSISGAPLLCCCTAEAHRQEAGGFFPTWRQTEASRRRVVSLIDRWSA